MSAGEAYISYISGSYLLILLLIITAIPSLGLCHTTAACLPEELSPGPSLNGARQGQALCSISLLIPVHLSSSSATCPLLPLSPPTLSLLNFTLGLTSICRTTNALTRIHFESCRVVGWMEIDDSISRMKLKESFWNCSPPLSSLLQLWCPSFHSLSPPLLAIIVLVCCVQPISLPVWGCAWDGYCKMQLKNAIHFFSSDCSLSSLNCHQISKHLKPEGLFWALLPAGCSAAI